MLVLTTSPFITSQLNGDEINIGSRILPALDSYDAGSTAIEEAVALIPFFLGRKVLRSSADTEQILRVLILAGLIYSFPAIFEIRFSPQLHVWIYGYFPQEDGFMQQIRGGGFRPVIFMGHGLLVSFFFCTTAVAAAAFWRTKTPVFQKLSLFPPAITTYLCFVLVLCKTLGSTAYAVILVPLVYLTKPKVHVWLAVLLASAALFYPLLRLTGGIPTGEILEAAASISVDRSESLEARFRNEDALLQRASERPLFGWGRYGRSRIYDESGRDITVSDGDWIIVFGTFGLVGFLAQFGLLALPIFASARAFRFTASSKDKIFLTALMLILAINIVDLIPNSSIRPWSWLIAGALLGRAETLRKDARLLRKRLPRQANNHEFMRSRVLAK